MRADNRGEGGIVALLALLHARNAEPGTWRAQLLVVGLIGAALLYGDGAITPAISVLCAIEGLKVDAPSLAPAVVPLTIVILIGLFLVQKKGAGFIGNITGTAASVGGPPVALLFQHHRGPTVRATLGAYFAISATLSVVGYGVTGAITLDRFLLAVALLPAMLFGAWASKHFHGLVDKGWLRPSVLVLSSIAGTIAVIRGLM